jgi:carboxypeptidase Taq
LPSGSPVSLSIHESQSRLWENNVGLSRAFIAAYTPLFKKYFPHSMANVHERDLFKAMNRVKPTLIRTASDELTYHFHIIIRFELEKAIIEKSLKPADLKDAWNEKYLNYMELQIPDDSQGVLQDIHWSHGSFGYFPTYTLGSLYAAQFYHFAEKEIGNLEEQIRNKQFSNLLSWLRTNIHSRGGIYNSQELCEKVTGEKLNTKYFTDYVNTKYREVYKYSL